MPGSGLKGGPAGGAASRALWASHGNAEAVRRVELFGKPWCATVKEERLIRPNPPRAVSLVAIGRSLWLPH